MQTLEQSLALGDELLTAVRLLTAGLRELNRMQGQTDFYHLPLLLLASGFERMMKVVLCCHHLETIGSFPKSQYFTGKKRGHNLLWLLTEITETCMTDEYRARPAAESDAQFLLRDKKLTRIVGILSAFGRGARYYNLNVVVGEEDPGPDPSREWDALKVELLKELPGWEAMVADPARNREMYEGINGALTRHCERLARALSRLFTIGGLGDQAKQISSYTHHFLRLRDSDLGAIDYEGVRI